MQLLRGLICATALGACQGATPLSKVIQLLQEMTAKGIKEKEDEATRFSAFNQWCGDQTRIKTDEIDAATDQINKLAAKIEKAAVEIQKSSDRIEELEEDVGRWAKDTSSASEVRDKEAADFKATSNDFQESLEALDGALITLKKRAKNIPQAELAQVLLQVTTNRLLRRQPAVKELENPNVLAANDNPQAYGYEFQSGGVVDLLEQLKDEFSKKKYDLDKEEMTAQHAFEDIAQLLHDNTENAKHEIDKKTTFRASVQQNKIEFEQLKAQTESDRAEDQKYLADTQGLCAQKTQDFNARQELRQGELEALAQATNILESGTVSGASDTHLPGEVLLQGGALALVQLGSGEQLVQTRAASFLSDRAKIFNSRLLALASQSVSANPFVKVKKMIKDMISKLVQESTAEIEHKGWCDTELTTNKQTRDQKTEAVDQLTADKEEQTSTIAQLTQEIEDLTGAIKELEVAMAEATADREASKEKNEQAIADAKAAQVAVEQATAVLKDFYAKSAQATALSQVSQTPLEDAPETFEKPYQGMLTEGGGVVDFMEVILSDFVRLQSETESSEAAEVDAYKKYMWESEKDQALKQNEKGHKEEKREDYQSRLAATDDELKLTQKQLDKAVAYYEKLKPTCVDSGITYEERVKRREDEIQSLQEALKILVGTDMSL